MGIDEGTVPERLAEQAGYCRVMGSPLYAALLDRAAEDAARDGVVAEVVEPVAGPYGSMLGLRLMGAVHRIVLQGGRRLSPRTTHPPAGTGTPGRRGLRSPISCARAPTRSALGRTARCRRTRSGGPLPSSAASSRLPVASRFH